MGLLTTRSKVAAYGAIGILAVAAITYFSLLSPKQRAAKHLEFVHKAITEMHPAILDPNATAFLKWHKSGYQKAKALLSLVHTEADEGALLRFYLAGYQDSHLNGYLDKKPYHKLDTKKDSWTGWLLKATSSGYLVTYRKKGDAYPPEHAQLISCDGLAIDEILHKHYAPYFDIRWHILRARDEAAKAFTQERSSTGILNRPKFTSCDFLVDNTTKTYPIKWSFISDEESTMIASQSTKKYRAPSALELAPRKLWIHASDFALRTPEATQSQKKLLEVVASIKDKKLVILDTRGNGGGSSAHGSDIFNAIFANDEKAKIYLSNRYDYKNQGANALFRASWQLYWSYDYGLKKIIQSQGKDSRDAKYLEAFLARLKQSLDSGEQTLYQDERSAESHKIAPPDDH